MPTLATPDSPEAQVLELNRLLHLGTPALVAADGQRMPLPPRVYELLKEVVRGLNAGLAVSIVSENQHVTTQRAAEILGMSRPHLVKLIEAGAMPFHRTGSHRRLLLRDVLAYQSRRDAARRQGLREMSQTAVAEGYYDFSPYPPVALGDDL